MPKRGAVKLLKKIKVGDVWKLAPALFDSKGRVRRDHVTVAGKDKVHDEGTYYLEWWSDGERTREAGGPDAFVAAARSGIMPVAKPEPADRITVKDALEKYEDYVRYHRSLRTYRTYRPILRSFAEVCPHAYIDEIERPALIDFATMYLKKGLSGKDDL